MPNDPQTYTCPFCGAVSHNPDDVRERYCGRCHQFATDNSPEGVELIVGRIKPLLAGWHPATQGAVLADLVAIWLASHPPGVRDSLLDFQVQNVRRLIPVNERIIFGPAGHPGADNDDRHY